MRVFKNSGNSDEMYKMIAGEMLNKEASVQYWREGRPAKVGTGPGDITKEEYLGYPTLITNKTVKNSIRSTMGYILVALGTDLSVFERSVMKAIEIMELTMNASGITPLATYHTSRGGYHTNIKVKSSLAVSQIYDDNENGRTNAYAVSKNTKRQFVHDIDDYRVARFVWVVKHIDQFDFTISSANFDDAIARFACSVFYDKDDICTLGHNETTFEFSQKMLKGSENVVRVGLNLFKYGNPLAFELSDHWKNSSAYANKWRNPIRNIDERHVYDASYEFLALQPVQLVTGDGAEETSTEICSKCRSLLWGDNYALSGSIKYPGSDTCSLICSLCAHTTCEDSPIEERYSHILRVTVPRTDADMIENAIISDERKEIYHEVMRGLVWKDLMTGDKKIKYIMIGTKYVAFKRIEDYLFTSLVNCQDFATRKVCSVNCIKV